ncbi:MAG TPA: hypothetical protein VLY24_15405 [Bryobacteraceae bacterium]|nr:hypothetical protein [Bryobacteraceae bacterium]
MDVSKILAELRAERALLDEVIANLERMATPKAKRGRPRKYPARLENFPPDGPEPPDSDPSEQARAARTA